MVETPHDTDKWISTVILIQRSYQTVVNYSVQQISQEDQSKFQVWVQQGFIELLHCQLTDSPPNPAIVSHPQELILTGITGLIQKLNMLLSGESQHRFHILHFLTSDATVRGMCYQLLFDIILSLMLQDLKPSSLCFLLNCSYLKAPTTDTDRTLTDPTLALDDHFQTSQLQSSSLHQSVKQLLSSTFSPTTIQTQPIFCGFHAQCVLGSSLSLTTLQPKPKRKIPVTKGNSPSGHHPSYIQNDIYVSRSAFSSENQSQFLSFILINVTIATLTKFFFGVILFYSVFGRQRKSVLLKSLGFCA